ncbi:MAG: TetR/AcrR family transcriptional regulator [Bacteroidales bacterium]|nr:TetR/AcrR family transcriptional regulator [Bacteroidales bacterium]
MSPRSTEKWQELKEKKKEVIFNASLQLFARKGFHLTTMDEIAQQVGISKGLLYNYFASKEELLEQLILRAFYEIEELFDVDRDGIFTAEEFEYFIHAYLKLLTEKIDFWKLIFYLMLQPGVQSILKKIQAKETTESIFRMLTQYLERNGFENAQQEVQILHYIFDGMTWNYIMNPNQVDLEMIKQIILKRYVQPFKK